MRERGHSRERSPEDTWQSTASKIFFFLRLHRPYLAQLWDFIAQYPDREVLKSIQKDSRPLLAEWRFGTTPDASAANWEMADQSSDFTSTGDQR